MEGTNRGVNNKHCVNGILKTTVEDDRANKM